MCAVSIAAATAAPAAVRVEERARALLALLIGIESTHARGTTVIAEAIAAELSRNGVPAQDIELLKPRPDKGNLFIRLRGTGKRKPILFIAHLDVVEARAEDWSQPPFRLTEADGYFYGRGTQDIKGEIAAALANLIRLHAEGYRPDRDLYFAFTSDEETGGTLNGVEWLLAHRPALRDVEYAVNFDAGGGDSEKGRPKLLRLQTSEKLYVTYELEVTNVGGHSSLPTPDNAIYRLAQGLTRIASLSFPLHLTETTRGYFAGLAETQPPALAADMRAVARDADPAAAARLSSQPIYNAALRTTCTATELTAGHAENALPQRARASIQCRLMPGESPEALRQKLREQLADAQIAVALKRPPTPSAPSPLNQELFAAVRSIVAELWPGVVVVPAMDAAATDCLYLRNAGIPTYGVSGIFNDIDDFRAHGRDERVRVRDFDVDVEFQYRLFRALGGGA